MSARYESLWSGQMSLKSRYIAVAFFGFGTAICCADGSMAAKEKSNLHLTEVMCGPAAIEKLDEKVRQGRIEECNSQEPKLDAGGIVAPIPTILAARKKAPKSEIRATTSALRALLQRRYSTPSRQSAEKVQREMENLDVRT
jgi:hypothetical protein